MTKKVSSKNLNMYMMNTMTDTSCPQLQMMKYSTNWAGKDTENTKVMDLFVQAALIWKMYKQ